MFYTKDELDNFFKNFNQTASSTIKSLRNKKASCLHPDCNEAAIVSHLLQRNGVLNHIQLNHHLHEPTLKDIYDCKISEHPDLFSAMTIGETGINKAFSGKLFCNAHDSSLFKPIESGVLPYSLYQAQLLLSYRAICSELRQCLDNLIVDTKMHAHIRPEDVNLKQSTIQEEELIFYLLAQKKLMERELAEHETSNKYTFISVKCKKLPIAVSTLLSSRAIAVPIFFHVIPQEQETQIVIGYCKLPSLDDFTIQHVQSWSSKNQAEIEIEITRILLTQTVNWCMSPDFYDLLSPRKKNILSQAHTVALNQSFSGDYPGFNLFDNKN